MKPMPIEEAIAIAERLERRIDEHPIEHVSLAEMALLSVLQAYRAQAIALERAEREVGVYKLYLFTIPAVMPVAIAPPAPSQEPSPK